MKTVKRVLIALILVSLVVTSLYYSVIGLINNPTTFLQTSGSTIIVFTIIVLFGLLWGKDLDN